METTNLPKPIKMALNTKDIITKNPEVLFRCLELLNPGIKMTYWKLIDRQADSKGQRLILIIDQESAKILKRMNLAAYIGVDKGLFKILSNSSRGKAGTKLTADQDEDAMEPMDVPSSRTWSTWTMELRFHRTYKVSYCFMLQ
jgi:hypothetical protein